MKAHYRKSKRKRIPKTGIERGKVNMVGTRATDRRVTTEIHLSPVLLSIISHVDTLKADQRQLRNTCETGINKNLVGGGHL
jgi:hypothetical protein